MKRSKRNITYFISALLVSSLLLFSNCKESGEEVPEDPQEKFVGTWTLDRTLIGFLVDGKSLEEFLLDNGASQDEVDQTQNSLISILDDAFGDDGEIELKADNTYVAKFRGDTDTGTWSYNASTNSLTIDSDDDLQEIDVISVTTSKLVIGLMMTLLGDLDEDGTDDEIEVQTQQEYIK